MCLPHYTVYIADHKLDTTSRTSTFKYGLYQHFSLQVVCPVHTHNNRTVPTLALEPEDPVMLMIWSYYTGQQWYTYIHSYNNNAARHFMFKVLTNTKADEIHLQFGTRSRPRSWRNNTRVLELSPEEYLIRTTSATGVLNSVVVLYVISHCMFLSLDTFQYIPCSTVVHTGRHSTSV
jgi:hypothetical protein